MKKTLAATAALLVGLTGIAAPSAARAEDDQAALYHEYDLSSYQWWFNAVGAGAAHQAGYTGEGVVVAVIDTGVDGQHPDLSGQVLAGADTSTGTIKPIEEGADSDDYGHGTHVAGIIASKDDGLGIIGIAPESKIVPVTPLAGGYGDLPEIAQAIDWATEQGVDVINLSLGVETDGIAMASDYDDMCLAIGRAAEAGVVVVVAAGNSGEFGNLLSSPAGCPGSISVSSVASNGRASWFTSFDPSVAVSAPGGQVLSTIPVDGDNWEKLGDPSGYMVLDGTSMAAPVVAGVAALLKQQNPDSTPEQVRQALTGSAIDLGRPGTDPLYGAGLVSATGALGLSSAPNSWLPVPHITSALLNIDDDIVLSWRLPGDEPVDGYTIKDFVTGEILAEAGSNEVRAAVPTDGRDALNLVVIAHLSGGQSVSSEPLYANLSNSGDGGGGGFIDFTPMTDMTAKWTKKGLKIKVERTEGMEPEDIALRLSAVDDSRIEEIDRVKIPAGKSSVIVPFAESSQYRGMQLFVSWSGRFGYWSVGVQPQWPLHVQVERVNADQAVVSGALNYCPVGTGRVSAYVCVGRTVSVTDRKGRTLARGVVEETDSGTPTFSVLVTLPSKKLAVTVGAFTSVHVRVPKF